MPHEAWFSGSPLRNGASGVVNLLMASSVLYTVNPSADTALQLYMEAYVSQISCLNTVQNQNTATAALKFRIRSFIIIGDFFFSG